MVEDESHLVVHDPEDENGEEGKEDEGLVTLEKIPNVRQEHVSQDPGDGQGNVREEMLLQRDHEGVGGVERADQGRREGIEGGYDAIRERGKGRNDGIVHGLSGRLGKEVKAGRDHDVEDEKGQVIQKRGIAFDGLVSVEGMERRYGLARRRDVLLILDDVSGSQETNGSVIGNGSKGGERGKNEVEGFQYDGLALLDVGKELPNDRIVGKGYEIDSYEKRLPI